MTCMTSVTNESGYQSKRVDNGRWYEFGIFPTKEWMIKLSPVWILLCPMYPCPVGQIFSGHPRLAVAPLFLTPGQSLGSCLKNRL